MKLNDKIRKKKVKRTQQQLQNVINEIEVRSCERDEMLLDLINGLRDGFIRELNKLNNKRG